MRELSCLDWIWPNTINKYSCRAQDDSIFYFIVLHILQAPNFVGVPLGFAQMVLYCFYRHKKSPLKEPENVDAVKEMESMKRNIEEDIKEYMVDIRIQLSVWPERGGAYQRAEPIFDSLLFDILIHIVLLSLLWLNK